MAQVKFLEMTERYSSRAAPWENILANRIGYGANATGGAGGSLVHVTNTSDSGAGSLRAACEADNNPAWIMFDVSGTITLSTEIFMKSNKTIDGRGQNIIIANRGLQMGFWTGGGNVCDNVIIHNIKTLGNFGNVTIGFMEGGSNIWVDHCTLKDASDEIFFMGSGASGTHAAPQGITVSWIHFPPTTGGTGGLYDDKAFLISDPSVPEDAAATLTIHHCWYENLDARAPFGRWATCHSFNNFHDRQKNVDEQPSIGMNFLSENEIFVAGGGGYPCCEPITTEGGDPIAVKVVGPWLKSGAVVHEIHTGAIFTVPYSYTAATADITLQNAITAGVGWQDVPFPS